MKNEQQSDIDRQISIMTKKEKDALKEIQETPIGQLEKCHQAVDDLIAAMEKTLVGKVIVEMFRSINYAVEHPLKAIRNIFLY